jgi:hypothetical protein
LRAGDFFIYLAKSREFMPTLLAEELIDRHIAVHLRGFQLNYNGLGGNSQIFV